MNYLGIEKKDLIATTKKLNTLLANYHLYYQNLRNFHWNVSGENFFDLHTQFEALYDTAKENIDAVAERILTLRMRPLSNLGEYLLSAEIEEAGTISNDREMVRIILDNHRILIQDMREVLQAASSAGDKGTVDLIGGMLQSLEKKSWMLDAWQMQHQASLVA